MTLTLAEIVAARPVPAAGLLATLTRRCPLSCAHCSTLSTARAEHADAGALRRFFSTLTPASRPEIVMLTGGEPLLRPSLVTELAVLARRSGARTAVLSGGFFARGGRPPAPALARALATLDHVSLSTDVWHEREVPRTDLFLTLRRLLDAGAAVSLHIVGTGPDDPYLVDVTEAVQHVFGPAVPMLVGRVRPIGRAASWAGPAEVAGADTPGYGSRRPPARPGAGSPCAMAAWPVASFDGTVTACCNEDVVDGPDRPAHLVLGTLAADTWATVADRCRTTPVLRAVRALGPHAPGSRAAADPCGHCRRLAPGSAGLAELARVGVGRVGALLDLAATAAWSGRGPESLLRRHACAEYAHLVGAVPPGRAGHDADGARVAAGPGSPHPTSPGSTSPQAPFRPPVSPPVPQAASAAAPAAAGPSQPDGGAR